MMRGVGVIEFGGLEVLRMVESPDVHTNPDRPVEASADLGEPDADHRDLVHATPRHVSYWNTSTTLRRLLAIRRISAQNGSNPLESRAEYIGR